MDEQIKNHLLEYLDKTAGAVEKLVDFSADQIPLVAKDVLTYNIWSNSFSILVLSFLLYKLHTSCRSMFSQEYERVKAMKSSKERNYPSYEIEFSAVVGICTGVGIIVSFVLLIHIFCSVDHLLKAIYAPRLFILDYIRGLK